MPAPSEAISRSSAWRLAGPILAVAWGMGLYGLRPGDPVAAFELVRWCEAETHGDYADPRWVDAERELQAVKPWQADYARAREELGRIERGRAASAP